MKQSDCLNVSDAILDALESMPYDEKSKGFLAIEKLIYLKYNMRSKT